MMKRAMTVLSVLSICVLATACMSTRVVLSPNWISGTKPAYTDYFDSYLFSLVGHPSVNLTRACVDQKPMAFQTVKAADDIIISVFTLGIYTPTTVKIWCGP